MRRHGCVVSRRARVVHRAQRYDEIERNERHSDKLGHEPAPSTHCTSISAGVDDAWWKSVEAAVALWSGIAAHSLTLVAFGLDSVIELASAGVVLWRLTVYVVAGAAWGLRQHQSAEFSLPGLLVAAIAIPTMVILSRAKIRVAEQLGSRPLRADAVEAIHLRLPVGGRHRWLDCVTSLAITYFLVKEGREDWIGDGCC